MGLVEEEILDMAARHDGSQDLLCQDLFRMPEDEQRRRPVIFFDPLRRSGGRFSPKLMISTQ